MPDVPVLIAEALVEHLPAFEERGESQPFGSRTRARKRSRTEKPCGAYSRTLSKTPYENALRYGASPLTVEQRGGALSFSNEVSDPESIDVDRLLERFYRADAVRGSRGAGLGLAMAAKLAEAMGMKLFVRIEEIRFVATLALAPDPLASISRRADERRAE